MSDNGGEVDMTTGDDVGSCLRETDLSGQQCAPGEDAGPDRHRSGPASFLLLSGETLAVGGMLMIMRLLDE